MYISICEVLNQKLKELVFERYGIAVGLNWPRTVVEPLRECIDTLNADPTWGDENMRRRDIVHLKKAVLDSFPDFVSPQPKNDEVEVKKKTRPKKKAAPKEKKGT